MGQNSGQDRTNTFKVIDQEEITVTTAGTPVNPSSNVNAVFVRVINNSTALVMVGIAAANVDATSTPPKGFPLTQYASRVYAVNDNASEVFIDASVDATEVSIEILERND